MGQKQITQPLGKKTNHATSQDKKIMQPLRTKKPRNVLGLKKIKLSGQKIKQPLGTIKITQPLGTKKTTHPLGTKKSRNLFGQK